jgi:hypothetical protein
MSKKHNHSKTSRTACNHTPTVQPQHDYEFTFLVPSWAPQEHIDILRTEIEPLSTSYHFIPEQPEEAASIVIGCTVQQGPELYARLCKLVFVDETMTSYLPVVHSSPDDQSSTVEYPYILPQDTKRLHIQTAAQGFMSALFDGAMIYSEEEVRKRINQLCTWDICDVPHRSNNQVLYREITVASFLTGYRLGRLELLAVSNAAKEAITAQVEERIRNSPPNELWLWYIESLKLVMQREQVETVDELLTVRLQEQ